MVNLNLATQANGAGGSSAAKAARVAIIIRHHGQKTRQAIAALAGCSIFAVELIRQALYADGTLPRVTEKKPRITDAQRSAAQAGFTAGKPAVAVALETGMNVRTAALIRQAMGLPPKPPKAVAAPMASSVAAAPQPAALVIALPVIVRAALTDYQARIVDSLMGLGMPRLRAMEVMRAKISADVWRPPRASGGEA